MLTRTRKAFTLLELIVVIVILGILALIAIPTFAKVIEKSRESAAARSAESLGREAVALAAFDDERTNSSTVTYDDVEAALEDDESGSLTVAESTFAVDADETTGDETVTFTVDAGNGYEADVTINGTKVSAVGDKK